MVVVRLKRGGAKRDPHYRIVAAERKNNVMDVMWKKLDIIILVLTHLSLKLRWIA